MDGQFFWMIEQGLGCSFFVLLSPVGWLLAGIALVIGWRAWNAQEWPLKSWLFLAWPALVCEALSVLGMIYWRDSDPTEPGEAMVLTTLTLAVYVLGSLLFVYFSRPFRFATCAMLMVGCFPVLGCWMVAAMAISGSWI